MIPPYASHISGIYFHTLTISYPGQKSSPARLFSHFKRRRSFRMPADQGVADPGPASARISSRYMPASFSFFEHGSVFAQNEFLPYDRRRHRPFRSVAPVFSIPACSLTHSFPMIRCASRRLSCFFCGNYSSAYIFTRRFRCSQRSMAAFSLRSKSTVARSGNSRVRRL